MTSIRLRLRSRLLAATLAAASTLAPAMPAQADVYVVVPVASPVKSMTQKQVVDLYMGRTRELPGGDLALPFDLPRDHPARAAFYLALTGLGPAQVNSYWSRLMFSGQTQPPQSLPSEGAMADLVRRNPSAVGYLMQEPVDKGLRVVLVLKDAKQP